MSLRKNFITIWQSLLPVFVAGCGRGGSSSPAAAPPATTGSVTVTITDSAGSFINSDVNDPSAPYEPKNDSDMPNFSGTHLLSAILPVSLTTGKTIITSIWPQNMR